MKKHIQVLVVLLTTSVLIQAQNFEDILRNAFESPKDIVIYNDLMFVGEQYDGKIYTVNMQTSSTTLFLEVEDGEIVSLAVNNDMLYYIDEAVGKVFRVPIENPSSNPEVVYQSNENPIAIFFNENDLFIAEDYSNQVLRMDVNNIGAGASVFITNAYGVEDMDIHGNYLYMAEKWNMGVSRASLDNPDDKEYVVNLLKAVAITFHDDMLYACTSSDLNNNTLYKVEVENWENQEVVIDNLFNPKGLTTYNDQVLIAETAGNRILSLNTNTQAIDMFIPGIGQNDEICRYGDQFFIGEANNIFSINALENSVTLTRLLSHYSLIEGMVINENELLFTAESFGAYSLLSLNLENPEAVPVEIATVPGGSDLLIHNEFLFIGGGGQVSRYKLNDLTAEAVIIKDNLDLVYDMIMFEDDLYFTEPWEQNLYMVSDAGNGATDAQIIYTEENIGYLAEKDGNLYFTSSNYEWTEHYIKRMDLDTYEVELFYQGTLLHNDLYMDDEITIYSSGFMGKEKLMRELHSNIGTDDIEDKEFNFEFANPVNDFIQINKIQVHSAQIINTSGKVLKKYSNQQSLDISDLPRGMYFLLINNKHHTKFIKI
jgi:hypothetical protein